MECLVHINKACLNCRFACKDAVPCNEWEPEEINPPFDNLCRGGEPVKCTNELCLDCPNATPEKRKVARDFNTLEEIADRDESGWAKKLPAGWKVKLIAGADFPLGRTFSVTAVYNGEGKKIGEVKTETNAYVYGDCRVCSMVYKNGVGVSSLCSEAKESNVDVEHYNETSGFDLLETLVWKFDKDWEDHAPTTWATSTEVHISYGEGKEARIVKVFNEHSEEIGAVLQWQDFGGVSFGYNAEPFETFKDAFISLSICVLGNESLKDFLDD